MLRIRIFEERVAELAYAKEIACPVHLYVGQEGIAAGVCANLGKGDVVFSTHRSHGHYLAKGGDANRLMAEIFGKETGASHGHGGSMHVVDPEVGFMGSSAIVAGTIPISVGVSLAIKMKNAPAVSVAFFGDGATDEGVFYESINFATLYKLPVIFICENNSFSTHMPDFLRQSNTEVYNRVAGFKMKTKRIDGNNPLEVYRVSGEMIDDARKGHGPALLECMTYRWLAHVGPEPDIDIGYRKKKDIDHWKSRCPIKALKDYLISGGYLTHGSCQDIERIIVDEVERAVDFAYKSPYPSTESIERGLWGLYEE